MLPVESTSTIPAMLACMGLQELSAQPFQSEGLVAAHDQAAATESNKCQSQVAFCVFRLSLSWLNDGFGAEGGR
jgi:hypothetical protein